MCDRTNMGVVGLTCSSVEMGDKGNLGIFLNLDKVPVREDQMTAYDIMCRRAKKDACSNKARHEDQAKKIFSK